MGIQLGFEGIDPDRLEGIAKCDPGKYHFQVVHFVEEDPDSPGNAYAECVVLAGTPASEVGKTHREYFNLKPNSLGRLAQFMVACHVVSREQIAAWKGSGRSVEITAAHFVGKQFCGRVIAEEYNGQTKTRLNFNLWAIDSKAAQGIPLDEPKAKVFLARFAPKSATQPTTPQQQPQQPAATVPAPVQPDPLGGCEELFG